MANLCITDCRIIGDPKELSELIHHIDELVDNNKYWIGDLIDKLGGDHEKIWCRAEIAMAELFENTIQLYIESAWVPPTEFFDFLLTIYPNLDLYYQAEEPGCGIFETNDSEFEYFDKYLCRFPEEEKYYDKDSLEKLLEDLGKFLNQNIKTKEEALELIELYNEKSEDYLDLIEFEVV